MTSLRDRLRSAAVTYRQIRYPGDLAEVLHPRQHQSRWQILSMLGMRAGLAAAAALVFFTWAHVINNRADAKNLTSFIHDVRADVGQMARLQPMDMARPPHTNAMSMLAPPEVPGLFSEVGRPVMSSAKFITTVGKEMIHRADALVRMG